MASAREKSLVDYLTEHFKDETVKVNCLEEFNSLFLEDETKHKRLFNSLSKFILCDESIISDFQSQFLTLMNSIHPYQINSADNSINRQVDRDAVNVFITRMIAFSCDQLLRSDGQMKLEFLKLFNCEKAINQIQICKFIFAHLHFIYQNIISSQFIVQQLTPLLNQFNAIAKVFNEQSFSLIAEHLRKTNRCFDQAALANLKPPAIKNDLIEYIKKPSTLAALSVVGFGIGLVIVGAKAITSFACDSGPDLPKP